MKEVFTLLCILIVSGFAAAQVRTVTGTLTSGEDGSPMPGVNIVIKGTTIGTVTDMDGYYSITAPIGSTLVFSFVGMTTREVIVTEDNLAPAGAGERRRQHRKIKPAVVPRGFLEDSVPSNTPGVAVLTDETPVYRSSGQIQPSAILKIRRAGKNYVIVNNVERSYRTRTGIQYTTSVSADKINRMPSLQNSYAQGRSSAGALTWFGPEHHEQLSFGPPISILEYDGIPYPYDNNGKLTTAGTGGGRRANPYDNLSVFRTGWTTQHGLILSAQGPVHSILNAEVEHMKRSGVIPNTNYQRLNASVRFRNIRLNENTKANLFLSYNRSTGNLLNRGANMATIVRNIMLTPASFDNANQYSPRHAINTAQSWRMEDASMRSYAPAFADNPYALLSQLPDNEQVDRLINTLDITYTKKQFTLTINVNADKQWNNVTFGIPTGFSSFTEGRLTHRHDEQGFFQVVVSPSSTHSIGGTKIVTGLSWQTQLNQRNLHRTDMSEFNGGFATLSNPAVKRTTVLSPERIQHELNLHATLEQYDWLTLRAGNRLYFSNTLSPNDYINLFPSLSIGINFAEALYFDGDIRLKSSVSRTLREAPLLYNDWAYDSTVLSSESFPRIYEATEIAFSENLQPEKEWKIEGGLSFLHRNIEFEAVYFNNVTRDFILPIQTDNTFSLVNAATVNNYGTTVKAGYHSHYYRRARFATSLHWTWYTSFVRDLHVAQERVPLAGFRTIQTAISKDEPFGAIYGTTWMRDAEGRRIIGDDGFPIADTQLRKIGNAIPDWTMGWSSHLNWRRYTFSFVFDCRKGGEMWNGTRAALDYTGRSALSATQRNVANYIFEGVTSGGQPNTTAVSFYDPALPVEQNKWVRYGQEGVGEAYIEDASWARLSELNVSWLYSPRHKSYIKSVKLTLSAKNLLIYTPYNGVDPAASLFGYRFGTGLDLFNAPATRSYQAQLTLKL
jgi:hypothetical protein